MPEKKDDVTGDVIPEPKSEVEPEPKSPTQPDEQLQRVQAELEEAKNAYTGLQRVMSKKDTKIQGYEAQARELEELRQQMASFGTQSQLYDKLKGLDTEDPELMKKIATVVGQTVAQDRAVRAKKEAYESEVVKVNEVKNLITDAGLDPDSDDFAEVEYFATQGRYALAKKKAQAVIAQLKPDNTPKETDAEKEERIKRELYDKENLLKSPGGSPSGASKSFKEKQAAYAAGEISWEEFRKAREEQGI